MSDLGRNIPVIFWKRQYMGEAEKLKVSVIDCPFCGEEHEHYGCGVTMSICGGGEYSIIAPFFQL